MLGHQTCEPMRTARGRPPTRQRLHKLFIYAFHRVCPDPLSGAGGYRLIYLVLEPSCLCEAHLHFDFELLGGPLGAGVVDQHDVEAFGGLEKGLEILGSAHRENEPALVPRDALGAAGYWLPPEAGLGFGEGRH